MAPTEDVVSPLSERPSANWAGESVMHIGTLSDDHVSPSETSPNDASYLGSRITSRGTSQYDPSTGQLKDGIVEDPGMHPLPNPDTAQRRAHLAGLQRESAGSSDIVHPIGLDAAVAGSQAGEASGNYRDHDDDGHASDASNIFHDGPLVSHYGQAATSSMTRGNSHLASPEPPSEKEKAAAAAAEARRSRQKRRRCCLFIFTILIVLAIIAIVLGTVLGLRARNSKDDADSGSDAPASQPSASSTPSASGHLPQIPRTNSTRGAWNGTGLALLPTIYKSGDYFQSYLIYQSFTGDMYLATVNFSDAILSNNISSVSNPVQVVDTPQPLPLKIALGSNLATQEVPASGSNPARHMLIYVQPNGTLADVWATGDDLGTWKPGNLSAANVTTALDNRAALFVEWDQCFGKSVNLGNGTYNWGLGGLRLWVGGADGLLHQYEYDLASGQWGDRAVTLASSWAYGAVVNARRGVNASCLDHHVLLTGNPDGSVSYYTAEYSFAATGNDTLWPTGAPWSVAKAVPTTTTASGNSGDGGDLVDLASNSSMVGGVPLAFDSSLADQTLLYAVGNDGFLRAAQLDIDLLYAGDAAARLEPTRYANISVMPGSALVGAQYVSLPLQSDSGSDSDPNARRGVNLIVFQASGNTIDWAVLADAPISGNAVG